MLKFNILIWTQFYGLSFKRPGDNLKLLISAAKFLSTPNELNEVLYQFSFQRIDLGLK